MIVENANYRIYMVECDFLLKISIGDQCENILEISKGLSMNKSSFLGLFLAYFQRSLTKKIEV